MSLTTAGGLPNDTSGVTSKSIPIHCIVEQLRRQDDRLHCSPTNQSSYIRKHDTYVIVPGRAPIGDLVRLALVRIGYTVAEGMRARGYIQVKNWKPLSFESITDDLEATVEEILGDLLPVATLWVRLTSDNSLAALEDIKDKLLHLLIQQSHSLLSSSGCPLDKAILSEITRADVSGVTISPEKQTTFDRWYHEQTTAAKNLNFDTRSACDKLPNRPKIITNNPDCEPPVNPAPGSPFPSGQSDKPIPNYDEEHSPGGAGNIPDYRSLTPHGNNNEGEEVEQLRLLRKWYVRDSKPSVDQMAGYADQLNVLRRRRGLSQSTSLEDVLCWFERAREADSKVPSNRSESADSGDEDKEDMDSRSGSEEHRLDRSRKRPRSDQLESSSSSSRSKALTDAGVRSPQTRNRGFPSAQGADLTSEFGADWRKEPEESTTSGMRDDNDDDDYFRCGMKYPDDQLCRRLPAEEATDLTLRAGIEPRIGGKKLEEEVHLSPESRALSVKAEIDSRLSAGGHVRKTHSACASPMTLPFLDPATDPSAGSFLLHRSYTPPQLRHFRHQHVMRLQAAMSQALNLHYIQHPNIYHPHPSFDSGRILLPGGNPRGPYKDPNRLSPTDSGVSDGDRRKRSRVFIDPLTEIPRLERWFTEDTHPSAYMIEQFTDELNRSPYRQRFPPLEPKNVQLWFKNHRAKVKRQKIELNSRSPS